MHAKLLPGRASRLKLRGTSINTLLRCLGRVASIPNLYGQDAFESCQVIFSWSDEASPFSLLFKFCLLMFSSSFQIGSHSLLFSFTFQIDEWLEYAPTFSIGSEFENACSYVDGILLKRTFLVGYSLSIADIAIWSGLAGEVSTLLN